MNNNIVLIILVMVSIFFGIIQCDNPLINFIEPLSRNDDKVTVYGRFLGNSQKEINVVIDLKNVTSNITEWSNSRIIIGLSLPNPKYSNITITTLVNSASHTIHFMNPTCLGIDVCNGHGICIKNQTSCLCNEPWSGADCSTISGDSMISIMNSNSNNANSRFTNGVFSIPNVFNNQSSSSAMFNTSVGLVLKEVSVNGYTLNSYLLSPSIQFGAITGRDFQVYRYRTNTLISSTDNSFNCDITLTHYLANQTKSIADQYIFEIKDSIGLVVIVNGHTSISHTNKLQLLIYPMINGIDQSSSPTTPKNNIIINDHDITKSIKMSIGKHHLKTSFYNFGLIPNNFTRFNTSIVEVKNTTTPTTSGLYSILSIETLKSYKYIYFSSDFYPHIDIEQEVNNSSSDNPLVKLSIFNTTTTYEQKQENKVITNDDSEEINNNNLSNNTILNKGHSEEFNSGTTKIFINFTNLVVLFIFFWT